jgi:hypothetical protein
MPENLTYDHEIDELLDRIEKSHILSRAHCSPRVSKIDLSFANRDYFAPPTDYAPASAIRSPNAHTDEGHSDQIKRLDAARPLSTHRRLFSIESSFEGFRNTLMAKLETLTDRMERSLKITDTTSLESHREFEETVIEKMKSFLESSHETILQTILQKLNESTASIHASRCTQECQATDLRSTVASEIMVPDTEKVGFAKHQKAPSDGKKGGKEDVISEVRSWTLNKLSTDVYIQTEPVNISALENECEATQTDVHSGERKYFTDLRRDLMVLEERLQKVGAFNGSLYELNGFTESDVSDELKAFEEYIAMSNRP